MFKGQLGYIKDLREELESQGYSPELAENMERYYHYQEQSGYVSGFEEITDMADQASDAYEEHFNLTPEKDRYRTFPVVILGMDDIVRMHPASWVGGRPYAIVSGLTTVEVEHHPEKGVIMHKPTTKDRRDLAFHDDEATMMFRWARIFDFEIRDEYEPEHEPEEDE